MANEYTELEQLVNDVTSLDTARMTLRWAHTAGSLLARPGCHLHGRASADGAIRLEVGCRFERLHAPTVAFAAPTTLARLALTSVSGEEPGLYGGTQDQSRCDQAAILAYLEQNPDKAAAWVAAQNGDDTLLWDDGRTDLTVDDLPEFFAELTPVTLLYDTRVTNHGFRDGRPTPRQSVLEAGTAVLVDTYGVPRARCACGNPLIPPIPSPTPPTWIGTQWPGFNVTVIIVVVPAPTVITNILIIDLTTGDLIVRPTGTSGDADNPVAGSTTTLTIPPDITVGTGDVQVTLLWATDSDMDLHVMDPSGVEIYFANSESPTGGMLDVDDIPGPGDTSTHVENVFWPPNGAPAGHYVITVSYRTGCGASPGEAFELVVRLNGEIAHHERGTLEPGSAYTFEFDYGGK